MAKAQTAYYDSITNRARLNGRGIHFLQPPEPVDAAENFRAFDEFTPWRTESANAATGISQRLGQPGSGILALLQQRAKDELALGGQLSEDEIRAATQGGRASSQMRGLTASPQGVLSEVLSRVLYSNQRKREREQFAAGVAGLEQQQQGADIEALRGTTQSSILGMALPESIRQFDTQRDDALATSENNWNWTAFTGGQAQAAARKARQAGIVGGVLGGITSVLGGGGGITKIL